MRNNEIVYRGKSLFQRIWYVQRNDIIQKQSCQ